MRVTVFTGNQVRHNSLIESIATIADEVYAVQECMTLFPGEVEDFYSKSPVMQEYFANVIRAEREVFGAPRFLPGNVRQLALRAGDLNRVALQDFGPALSSDVFVVFGSSFIRGALVEFLVNRRAYNVHMGVSPYFRGDSCNFWALYGKRPDLVGGTIHLLTKGLDSGPMLFHAFPPTEPTPPFLLGMRAVRAAHAGLVHNLRTGDLKSMEPVDQDRSLELRYSRRVDFTDNVAVEFLERNQTAEEIGHSLRARDNSRLLRPFVLPVDASKRS